MTMLQFSGLVQWIKLLDLILDDLGLTPMSLSLSKDPRVKFVTQLIYRLSVKLLSGEGK